MSYKAETKTEGRGERARARSRIQLERTLRTRERAQTGSASSSASSRHKDEGERRTKATKTTDTSHRIPRAKALGARAPVFLAVEREPRLLGRAAHSRGTIRSRGAHVPDDDVVTGALEHPLTGGRRLEKGVAATERVVRSGEGESTRRRRRCRCDTVLSTEHEHIRELVHG